MRTSGVTSTLEFPNTTNTFVVGVVDTCKKKWPYTAHSAVVRSVRWQQMSPVMALDIAVVAQKVKDQYRGPVWSEKSGGGGGSVVGRDGY